MRAWPIQKGELRARRPGAALAVLGGNKGNPGPTHKKKRALGKRYHDKGRGSKNRGGKCIDFIGGVA